MDRAGADPDGGERMRRRRRGKCDMQEGGREGVRERERERDGDRGVGRGRDV